MRKQLMLFTALLLISCPIFAQDESSEESSSGGMAGTGDLLFEVTGTPFGSGTSFSSSYSTGGSLLNFSEFRARYFLAEVMALRLGLAMNLNNDQPSPDLVINDSYYGVMPGFEYHVDNDGSFRSYAAIDLIFGQQIASRKSSTDPTILGATGFDVDNESLTPGAVRGFMEFGGRLSIGAEYHFNSRFYIGGEIGFQYAYRMNDEIFSGAESVMPSTISNVGFLTTANSLKIGFRFLTL